MQRRNKVSSSLVITPNISTFDMQLKSDVYKNVHHEYTEGPKAFLHKNLYFDLIYATIMNV